MGRITLRKPGKQPRWAHLSSSAASARILGDGGGGRGRETPQRTSHSVVKGFLQRLETPQRMSHSVVKGFL